jgi:hypothetical protein
MKDFPHPVDRIFAQSLNELPIFAMGRLRNPFFHFIFMLPVLVKAD